MSFWFWSSCNLHFVYLSVSCHSQLGSDVIPRDPISGARRLLRWPPASCPQGHAWQLEWVWGVKGHTLHDLFATSRFVLTTEIPSLRTVGTTRSEAVHEPQQRWSASQVSHFQVTHHESQNLLRWTLHNLLHCNCETNLCSGRRSSMWWWWWWWLTRLLLFLQISGTGPADQENQRWDHHHNVSPSLNVTVLSRASVLSIGFTQASCKIQMLGIGCWIRAWQQLC